MKIKIDQIRTYDDAGFRRRAACLCFRSECETEILLVSSSRFHDLWIVPGGGLEPGEEPATTAVREVLEEAGVVGELGRLLNVFENKDRNTRTYVYVLVVGELKSDYEDSKKIGRLRNWFPVAEAKRRLALHKPVHEEYIDTLLNDEEHQRRASLCTINPSSFSSITPQNVANISCAKCRKAHQQTTSLETDASTPANNVGDSTAKDEGRSNTSTQQTGDAEPKTERGHELTTKNAHDVQLLVNITDVKPGSVI